MLSSNKIIPISAITSTARNVKRGFVLFDGIGYKENVSLQLHNVVFQKDALLVLYSFGF